LSLSITLAALYVGVGDAGYVPKMASN
jgi:hypothetical protein